MTVVDVFFVWFHGVQIRSSFLLLHIRFLEDAGQEGCECQDLYEE